MCPPELGRNWRTGVDSVIEGNGGLVLIRLWARRQTAEWFYAPVEIALAHKADRTQPTRQVDTHKF
jgi:hypothetical protein